ncbi:MAG: TRAP transporter substrate-binding protein [Betaproteobacteria bacterium]|nr:TRAP transporter substrate-binding protein [Betaproteobacteria bacterium]
MRKFTWRSLAAFVALGFSAHAPSQDKIELKVTTFVPPTHGFVVDVLEPWVKDLEKRTGGKLSGRVFAGNSPFGKTENQADQVKQGVTDVGWGLNGIPRGRLPRSSIMEFPFVADSANAASKAMWAMLPGMIADDYKGFKVLALHCHNPGLFHTRDKKLDSIFDVKGLRMRAPNPPTQALLQHLGAAPVGMPPGQVYESLEKGVIDGAVFPWDAIKGFRLETLLKNHLDARVYTSCFHIVMNEAKYAALPADARKAVDDTSGPALVNKFGEWWNKWDQAGLEAVKARNNAIVSVSNDTREKWRVQLKPVIDQELAALEKSGIANARQIYDEMLKQVAKLK